MPSAGARHDNLSLDARERSDHANIVLLAFRRNDAHMSVAGAIRDGPRPSLFGWTLAITGQVPLPEPELRRPSVDLLRASSFTRTGKGFPP